jgi:ParB-like nuclease domain
MAKSWRDVLPIHRAAEQFPPVPPDELRALGEDIRKHGLRSPIVLWKASAEGQVYLLDGRNRLDAIQTITGTCPRCSSRGAFGYRNEAGALVWYCEQHRLAQWWADARRHSLNPTPKLRDDVARRAARIRRQPR